MKLAIGVIVILLPMFCFGLTNKEENYNYGSKYRVQVTFPEKPNISEIGLLGMASATLITEDNNYSFVRMKTNVSDKEVGTENSFNKFRDAFIAKFDSTEVITDTVIFLDTLKYLSLKFAFQSDSLDYSFCQLAYIPFRHQFVTITVMSFNSENTEEVNFWNSLSFIPPKAPKPYDPSKEGSEFFISPERTVDFAVYGLMIIGLILIITREIKKRKKKKSIDENLGD